jgi:hypothetical protein
MSSNDSLHNHQNYFNLIYKYYLIILLEKRYFMSYIYVLLGLLILIFIILLVIDYRRVLAKKHFIKLAKKLNLQVNAPEKILSKFPEIKGTYKGYEVKIFMYPKQEETVGTLKKIKLNTAIEIKVNNPKKYRLNVYEQGPISTIGKYFGMQDVVIGHPEFDKEYIVKTNDDYITHQILTKHICDELVYMASKKFGFGFQFGPENIHFEESVLMINESKALLGERILNILVQLYDEFNLVSMEDKRLEAIDKSLQ